ncbi:hypothetical protein Pelo_15191 [Pelomyxa schiedti]|nr:hypothetical protein Pelo_15191 [Pelomyxa schiedti]
MIESYVVVPVAEVSKESERSHDMAENAVPKYGYTSCDEARPLLPALSTENAPLDAQKKDVYTGFLGLLLLCSCLAALGLIALVALLIGVLYALVGLFFHLKGNGTKARGFVAVGAMILVMGSTLHLSRALLLLFCSFVLMVIMIRKCKLHWGYWILFVLSFIAVTGIIVVRILVLHWITWSHILLTCVALPVAGIAVLLCDSLMDSAMQAIGDTRQTRFILALFCSLTCLVLSLYI